MPLSVGFAEVDITPPVGTRKIGWITHLVGERIMDPLFARAAVFEGDGEQIGFVQLDTLCIRWTTTNEIRRRIKQEFGFPGQNIMVAATHNHCGPAVANCGDSKREDGYVESMVTKTVEMFGQALRSMEPAEVGFGSTFEFGLSHNRRVIMRDGTVRTHGTFDDPLALCLEGPIDPEVAVLAVRAKNGSLLGALVNFTCHPTHHGGEVVFSAGYPGDLVREMKARGCPMTLFLNGACGNVHHSDPVHNGASKTKEEMGAILAADADRVIKGLKFRSDPLLACKSSTIRLPFRHVTDEEVKGTVWGAQRFIDTAAYDRDIPKLLERVRQLGTQTAEVQVLAIDEVAFAAIPAEYFVQHGLRIKEQSHPQHALVVSHANGMVGYVPHFEAFVRGGYETTFWSGSRLAPEAGDLLADTAIRLINDLIA